MIYKKQLIDLIDRTLKEIDQHSTEAVQLVAGTIAQESHGGFYLRQLGKGTALGITLIEPSRFRYLQTKFPQFLGRHGFAEVEYNLKLAIICCRLKYKTIPEPIPLTLYYQACYWKKYYNSEAGSGTPADYIQNYNFLIED
jgi:hypothetical protein